jgi:outer membrane murein-binding lipoprotein Lpp
MVANAEAIQGLDYGRVIGAEEATEPRRRALSRQAMIGLGLIVIGLVALLVTWAQIKDIQNIAAQIPYVASGGLLGVALAVIGGVALFSGTRTANAETTTVDDLAAQVADLSVQVKWTADAVEQIADYLNELAQSGVDTSTRRR